MPTLEQTIRNAVEAELASRRFYLGLVSKGENKRVRSFFELMATQEAEHAAAIEAFGKRIVNGELPAHANDSVGSVETVPGWEHAESISLEEAFDLAISAEQNAALYYDAIADFFTGEGEKLFRDLSASEQKHAEMLVGMRKRLRS